MFCTKCGKELHEGDIFCAYCGNKVRAQAAFENNMGRYSEVVFNPPFKVEAQRRTEEITREVKKYSQEPRRESLQFDWNLDGFPGTGKRKDEDFKFNWDDVLEKKRDSREIEVEKILFVTEEEKPEEPKEDKEAVPVIEPKEETPFEELFADKSKNNKPLSLFHSWGEGGFADEQLKWQGWDQTQAVWLRACEPHHRLRPPLSNFV